LVLWHAINVLCEHRGDGHRWEAELAMYSLTPLTLWAGVYAKAFRSFEVLVASATAHWVSAAQQPGHAVAAEMARGKSLDRLTVGQRVEILRRLCTLGLIANQDHARWQADMDLLGRLVKKRNDFAHGRFVYDERNVAAVQAFLC
jgi:hypothetical protein